MSRYFIQWFDPVGDEAGSWAVLDRFGCSDMDHRIVCDRFVLGGDEEQAKTDAQMICDALNKETPNESQ